MEVQNTVMSRLLPLDESIIAVTENHVTVATVAQGRSIRGNQVVQEAQEGHRMTDAGIHLDTTVKQK